MLSRSPASRASRSCSRGLVYYSQIGSRQLRCGTASYIQKQNIKTASRQPLSSTATPTISSKGAFVPQFERWQTGKRLESTAASAGTSRANRKDEIYALIDAINQHDRKLAEILDDLNLLDHYRGVLSVDGLEWDHAFSQTVGHQDGRTLESRVHTARQQFSEALPKGYLNDNEMKLYIQLYGEPIAREAEPEIEQEDEEPDRLYREDGQGGWEEVQYEGERPQDDLDVVYDMEVGVPVEETIAMRRTREVAEQLGGEVMLDESEDEPYTEMTPRKHPLTQEGQFATQPSTIQLPKDAMTIPISAILYGYSNKHVSEAARKLFGGPGLPHSTTTAPPQAQLPQLPIPLQASHRHMTDMEANAFIAALYPGIYASSLSILVEVRKRLGSDWIRGLMSQEGGPNVLDAGGGGAGILAWREVLRAEVETMDPDRANTESIPFGRSTVLAGSDALQARASVILENTTFLPRLPDYVHIRESATLDDDRAPKRKQYDLIIAPHNLLGTEEDFERKEHVENLWSLLNPNGGVLVLFEKGRQRGFEAVAGARDMLLKRYISSPGSTEYEDLLESPAGSSRVEKEPGMIIAPCTNHEKCPMYSGPGPSKGRRDYCYFGQRFHRPPFLQRIIGNRAKDHNHEDVQFSYLAVQRGIDLRKAKGIVQGAKATNAAFAGYEGLVDMTAKETPGEAAAEASTEASPSPTSSTAEAATPQESAAATEHAFHTLSLPRIIYQPMKRRGHAIFDLCTPAGQIERWTVPRSYSPRAYKDARKARWGDLWALGAKTRIHRPMVIGDKHGEGKKERMARRAADKAAMREEKQADDENTSSSSGWNDLPIPTKQKGETIPNWKKKVDKKKLRQAMKKQSASL